jgi:uncharacterized protein with von Willebrand factor type A (vWA) domain
LGSELCLQVIEKKNSQLDGSEIVLLTDGEDNTASSCVETVKQSGVIIHLIALGPDADAAVTEMSDITGKA